MKHMRIRREEGLVGATDLEEQKITVSEATSVSNIITTKVYGRFPAPSSPFYDLETSRPRRNMDERDEMQYEVWERGQ